VPGRGTDPGPPAFELGLLSLLLVAAAAAVVLVWLPLRLLRQRRRQPHTLVHATYFGGIGLGYMAVELAFIQKFGLLLGHPNYALSVVLASLLLATGLGSLVSDGLVRRLGGQVRFVSYALAGILLVEVLLIFPRLGSWFAYPFAARVLVVVALVVPAGFLLGVYFPVGLSRLKRDAPELVPWAWGLNGMASVVAPVLSVAVSVTAGISALLVAAIPIYMIAGFAVPRPRPEPRPA
jgi:hypothetical protein